MVPFAKRRPSRRTFLQGLSAAALALLSDEARAGDEQALDLPISGQATDEFQCIDRMMASFVSLYDVPGAAMAVTRNGKLVYARGFGYADVENKTAVEPHTLFRIASVSKPVTGAAVMKLVDQHKLELTDHAFPMLSLKPHVPAGATVDPRINDITIQQLLHHTGGWDREISFDPMGKVAKIAKEMEIESPAMQESIIRYMLGKPLDFAPGMRDAYSNFGYCVLGRVIEKVTGLTYEEVVQKEVLAPLKITQMKIGRSLLEGRAENETRYYDIFNHKGPSVMAKNLGEKVPLPYGTWSLEAMDAHGGWIASVVDLARFAVAFDDPEHCPILSAKGVATMFDRPPGNAGYDKAGVPKDAYYACGWSVRPQGAPEKYNTWHGGLLPGTAAWLVRRSDNIHWIVLFNSSMAPNNVYLGDLIDFFGHHAIGKVKDWPEIDLFAN